ncbi:MAG: imidazole glycerol phosphate synthase cyclase subunit [Candidatus Eremiobacteraeota bacterium]|nr:imidazole glycerol phosphate synthase cyclase subunit [Candidatus Eremiobacteraeota bacterium]
MLRNRVIPIVLLVDYAVVKTIQFTTRRNLGNPVVIANIYENRKVDEIVFLDIDASKQGRGLDVDTINAVVEDCFMPITIGGGLRNCEDIEKALRAGADKVSLNSILLENMEFLKEAVSVFGSQCITVSIDVKKNCNNDYIVYSHAHKDVNWSLTEFLRLVSEYKAGEILLNNVDLDGTMKGYDLQLINLVSSLSSIPVIAAGGASKPSDCADAIKAGASAVAASSIFHFTSITPRICKRAMAEASIPVRL